MNLLLDGLPDEVVILGQPVKIAADFRTGVLFSEMLQDASLDDNEKLQTALALYFPDIRISGIEAVQDAADRIVWFYRCGKDVQECESTSGDSGGAAFSYEHDADYIYAAFMQAYGIDLSIQSLHWWQFQALFRSLPEDTLFMKIVGFRTMKIPAKTPKEQKQYYQRMKRLYRLPENAAAQQLESDLSALLMAGGNPSELLKGDR